jgi:hypothetical protein
LNRCIASQGEYFEGDHSGIQQWGVWHFYRDEFANFIVSPRMSSSWEPSMGWGLFKLIELWIFLKVSIVLFYM